MSACSSVIGQDLLLEIFKRLPAKTLCRFLCVCKSWETLISSPSFINLHNSFTSSTKPPNLKPYLRVHLNSFTLCLPQDSLVEPLKLKLHFPFRTDSHYLEGTDITLVDIVHGVVCLSYSFESSFDATILWNPAIHKYVALPWLPFSVDLEAPISEFQASEEFFDMTRYVNMEGVLDLDAYIHDVEEGGNEDNFVNEAEFHSSVIGFGYDRCNSDFKVVRIWIPNYSIMPYCKTLGPRYEVYSSKQDTWREETAEILESCGLLDQFSASKTGCFVNGTIHWIIHALNENKTRARRSVLMFDCEREEFRIVELPREILLLRTEDPKKTKLIEYAGMLAVVVANEVELWVMEEHGVAATWKKLYRFRDTNNGFKPEDIYEDSFVDMAPYGPKEWTKFHRRCDRYNEIVSGHVYEESMFLGDHPEVESHRKEEIVCVSYYY